MKVCYFMGRKTEKTHQETSIAFKPGTEFRLFEVELPYSVKVTFEITKPPLTHATSDQIIYLPMSEKEKIVNTFEKNGYNVIHIEPQTIKIPDLCPKCLRRGIPKVEKKDTTDRRVRTWKNKEEKPRKKRPNEYWLTFDHKSKPKKCRIRQFVHSPHPAFRPRKSNNIDFMKFLFPYNMPWLENQISPQ